MPPDIITRALTTIMTDSGDEDVYLVVTFLPEYRMAPPRSGQQPLPPYARWKAALVATGMGGVRYPLFDPVDGHIALEATGPSVGDALANLRGLLSGFFE